MHRKLLRQDFCVTSTVAANEALLLKTHQVHHMEAEEGSSDEEMRGGEVCHVSVTCLHLTSRADRSGAILASLSVKNVNAMPVLSPRAVRPIRCT